MAQHSKAMRDQKSRTESQSRQENQLYLARAYKSTSDEWREQSDADVRQTKD
jgi:hypothetical protein